MESKNENQKPVTPHGKTLTPEALNKLLMRYQGIFKHQIPEFAKRLGERNHTQKNYSR